MPNQKFEMQLSSVNLVVFKDYVKIRFISKISISIEKNNCGSPWTILVKVLQPL